MNSSKMEESTNCVNVSNLVGHCTLVWQDVTVGRSGIKRTQDLSGSVTALNIQASQRISIRKKNNKASAVLHL